MGKKNQAMNEETMDIKNHLDTSFDYDNIVVSEDLIERTLKAVKERGEEGKEQGRTFPWRQVRRLGVAAATIVLLAAGAYAINDNLPFYFGHNKSADRTNEMAVRENANGSSDGGSQIAQDQDNKLLAGGEEFDQPEMDIAMEEESLTIEESEKQNQMSVMDALELKADATFMGLYSIRKEDIVRIEAVRGETTKESREEAVITEMVQLLNEYTLKEEAEEEKISGSGDNSREQEEEVYEIRIFTRSEENFTIVIGEKLQVKKEGGSSPSMDESLKDTITKNYSTEKVDELVGRIDKLIDSMP